LAGFFHRKNYSAFIWIDLTMLKSCPASLEQEAALVNISFRKNNHPFFPVSLEGYLNLMSQILGFLSPEWGILA